MVVVDFLQFISVRYTQWVADCTYFVKFSNTLDSYHQTHLFISLITTRQRSCGKVMFSQTSVCPQGLMVTHPPSRIYGPGIRLTSGRYPSYWNAFLIVIVFVLGFKDLNSIEVYY